MKFKPPLNDGEHPSQEWWLDNSEHRRELGYERAPGEKIADLYAEYLGGKYYVIEFKSKDLYRAISQVENSAKKLFSLGHKVTDLAIVVEGIKKSEKSFYKRDSETHEICNSFTKRPLTLRLGSKVITIKLIYPHELKQQYKQLKQSKLGGSESGHIPQT